jgi:hypothetical protein
VCLNVLRSRSTRREEPMGVHVPDPVISRADGTTPRMRRCWPTPSGWRYTWCWTRWPPRSGWRSSCMTCSTCPSTRSPPWWGVPRPRRGNSLAGPGAGYAEPMSCPRPRYRPPAGSGRRLLRRGAPR